MNFGLGFMTSVSLKMSGDTISLDGMALENLKTSTTDSPPSSSKSTVPTKYVKLNVGGSLFYTTLGTLTKRADSMLRAMFSGRMEVLTDSEGLHQLLYQRY